MAAFFYLVIGVHPRQRQDSGNRLCRRIPYHLLDRYLDSCVVSD